MERRLLGRSGLKVSPLAFGGNIFGWTVDERTSFKLLDAFVDAGFNLIDTADVYSNWAPGNKGGESETIIGKWLRQGQNRQRVAIVTKVGLDMGLDQKGLSKAYVLSAVEDSLKRLQTDYIDVYMSHIDDPHTPLEETLGVYAELIGQGKIGAVGASNYGKERLAESLQVSEQRKLPGYVCIEPLYNLYDRADFEGKLQPLCTEKGLGVIPYFSLASGFLTGKYRSENDLSQSARSKFVKRYLNERGFRILQALDTVAKRLNTTPAKIALAWLVAQPGITAPIASATSVEQLRDLIDGVNLKLDQAAVELLDLASTA
jgi:aryl-alcohol dehydrogenase-like predicted oxidoreductase